jgi:hypothetical protein
VKIGEILLALPQDKSINQSINQIRLTVLISERNKQTKVFDVLTLYLRDMDIFD